MISRATNCFAAIMAAAAASLLCGCSGDREVPKLDSASLTTVIEAFNAQETGKFELASDKLRRIRTLAPNTAGLHVLILYSEAGDVLDKAAAALTDGRAGDALDLIAAASKQAELEPYLVDHLAKLRYLHAIQTFIEGTPYGDGATAEKAMAGLPAAETFGGEESLYGRWLTLRRKEAKAMLRREKRIRFESLLKQFDHAVVSGSSAEGGLIDKLATIAADHEIVQTWEMSARDTLDRSAAAALQDRRAADFALLHLARTVKKQAELKALEDMAAKYKAETAMGALARHLIAIRRGRIRQGLAGIRRVEKKVPKLDWRPVFDAIAAAPGDRPKTPTPNAGAVLNSLYRLLE